MNNYTFVSVSRIFVAAILSALMLAGCSKSSSSPSSNNNNNTNIPTAQVKITGTAATGAAIANATISIKGANGVLVSATTDSLGQYTSPDIASLTAPYLLKITKPAAGTTAAIDFYSVGNAAGTVNIHPLTDLIIKAWYEAKGTTVATAFGDPTANAPPTTTEVTVIKQVVKNLVSNWLVLDGVDPDTFDLITSPFNANQTQFDRFLDKVKVVDASTLSLNTSGGINPAYQIALTGALATGYTSVVKAYSTSGTYNAITTVATPVGGTATSPYAGTWSLSHTPTAIGSPSVCGGVAGDIGVTSNDGVFVVQADGRFVKMELLNPSYVEFSGTIAADGTITATVYGDSLHSTGTCPAGTLNGTLSGTSGSGGYSQGGDTGTLAFTRVTASPYAGAWVLQRRLNSIASTGSPCGSVAANVGKIMATEPVVVGIDGRFVVMSKQYPGYVDALGMINATNSSLSLTFYGDSNKPITGTCPASTSPGGTMSSVNYGTDTVSQGGDVIGITLTRGTTATVGAIVGSWTGTDGASGNRVVTTILANGEYVQAIDGTAGGGGQSGMERGVYNWNAITGAFSTPCPPVDTNGEWGFSHQAPSACTGITGTVVVSGNTLTYNGGTSTATRVAADTAKPIVGSWAYNDTVGHRGILTFMANGEYVQVEDGPSVNGGMSGMERGTYTLNASTGAFATPGCPAVDTNGEWGFSHPVGGSPCAAASGTFTVSGNTLTMTGTSLIFSRVVP